MLILSFQNYFLSSLVVAFGIFSGMILARVASEEIADGKRYFRIFKLVFAAGLGLLFIIFNKNIIMGLPLSIILIALVFFRKDRPIYIYPFNGAILFFSQPEYPLFLISSILLFLIGFPAGSMLRGKKGLVEALVAVSAFIAVANVLFLVL